MHIPDGFLNVYTSVLMFAVSLIFIVWAWKGIKRTLPKSFLPSVAVCSSMILIVQLVEFPVAGGASTWHMLGGTLVSIILGPHGAIISMTIVLMVQTLLLGDGGVSAFGANVFNMAVIGGLSFYIVKFLLASGFSGKRFAASLFIATFLSNLLTALATGVEIGFYPIVAPVGGVAATVPAMLVWYVPSGLVEATVTVSVVLSLSRIIPGTLHGLNLLQRKDDLSK